MRKLILICLIRFKVKIRNFYIFCLFPLNFLLFYLISANIFSDDTVRNSIETKKFPIGNINIKDIKETAKDIINNFVKKYDKIN